MRRVILLTTFAAVVVAFVATSTVSAAGGSDRPVMAIASGSMTLNLLTGQVSVAGSGTATHLGLTTLEEQGQLTPAGPLAFSWSGMWIGTAANGDRLLATSTGTATFTDATHATGVLTYTVSGGTGRFTDAAGTMTATLQSVQVSVDGTLVTKTWQATIRGRLTY